MIRFWLVGLLFWPIFIVLALREHWVFGVVAGFAVIAVAEAVTWRLTFGTWPNLAKKPGGNPPEKHPDTNGTPDRK